MTATEKSGSSRSEFLRSELEAKGISLSFVEVKSALREVMRQTGLEGKIGADHFYESIEDGVQAFQQLRKQMPGEQA